ncbi:MAG: class II glutamine amidotransferase [Coriobacteriaceae bacterium]|jgi:glutamine amidotransferase|nr:class II glutamine amidotransferase [Coriobacteriaceae bacterium]
MCELLAISLPAPAKVNQVLSEFFSHGTEQPHGWGFALQTPLGPNLEKEPQDASKSTYLQSRLSSPILATQLLAHIRYATKGSIAYANCHPFLAADQQGGHWMLVHNGTVFDPEKLSPFLEKRQGETDSEGVLFYILDALSRSSSTQEARFTALAEAIAALSPRNKLNLILNDGTFTYVHTNFLKQSLFSSRWHDGLIFSTRPLAHGTWEQVPLTQLLVFHQGKPVFASKPHGAVYEEDPEELRVLYQEYAML